MAERKFKFVSPGIFINEIDNSQLPKVEGDVGPLIIGRAERGPAMRPVKVNSFSQFVEVFGYPIPGGEAGDVWRFGNYLAPTYAGYAAQAWLKNNNALTFVRLLGAQHADASAGGKAGWQTANAKATNVNVDLTAGAYGLFVVGATGSHATGTLAAVLYGNKGTYFTLSGSSPDTTNPRVEATTMYVNSQADQEFILRIRNGANSLDKEAKISLKESSPYYIRKVLNTNPAATNSAINTTVEHYWLGETYEGMVQRHIVDPGYTSQWAWIGALEDNGGNNHADRRMGMVPARTGWVFPQDLTTNTGSFSPSSQQKLFRFVALENGEWEQQNLKVSIQDIKRSTSTNNDYGSFSVVLRYARDNDSAPQIVERFTNCNLNPNSVNYVARKVGDKYSTWSDAERRHRHYGSYSNNSQYFRIQMNEDVDNGGINAELLPFGFYGAPRYKRFAVSGGFGTASFIHSAGAAGAVGGGQAASAFLQVMVRGSGSTYTAPGGVASGSAYAPTGSQTTPYIAQTKIDARWRLLSPGASGLHSGNPGRPVNAWVEANGIDLDDGWMHTFLFPAPSMRVSSSDGDPPSPKSAYFGVTTNKSSTSTRFDRSYNDCVRALAAPFLDGNNDFSDSNTIEISSYFTLDDLVKASGSTSVTHAYWDEGSRKRGESYRAQNDYTKVIETQSDGTPGFNRFTLDFHGGFDGLDITEKDPFRNTLIEGTTTTPLEGNSYAYNSIKRAIDSVADPEVAEYNLMVCPGLYHEGLTNHMLNVCEDRGDALAILDLKGDYTPFTETNTSFESRKGDVDTTINNLRNRGLNTSYGCCYYPWVQIRDPQVGSFLWVPPSVAALGTFASSEKVTELWFAPAGFKRGGLTDGAAGLPVIGVTERLVSEDRDKLYEANINPIASFPNEGIVIFGQKTLQITPSALDRVNVRRLMIYVKKQISRMAKDILFDQNVEATWQRFLSKAKPFLRSVKVRFGLDDFKVVLDNTTTTPDLIDRNIMYAKIFLKPTKAIEYIALDFTITNDGAAFAD